MIPVCYDNGELAGILSLLVSDHVIQRGSLALQYGQGDERQVIMFNVGWWARQVGDTWMRCPCIVAPTGWTLDQLRQLKYFR